jgi:hypothetical protein
LQTKWASAQDLAIKPLLKDLQMRRVAPQPQLRGKTSDIRCAHPPCSQTLAPADFFLFLKLKTTLKQRRFPAVKEIQESTTRELGAITESAFQEAFQ